MKVPLQLSIDLALRSRLKHDSEQTGIPVSRIVSDLVREHLATFEERHNIQGQLITEVEAGN